MGNQPSATSAARATFFGPSAPRMMGISRPQRVDDGLQRLAQSRPARVGERVVGPVVGDRGVAGDDLADDVQVLAGPGQRLGEGLPVPALDDLGTGHAEPEHEATARQVVEGDRRHAHGRRGAGRHLAQCGAQADPGGGRAPPAERGEGVGAEASAVQIESNPRFSASATSFGASCGGPAPQYPTAVPTSCSSSDPPLGHGRRASGVLRPDLDPSGPPGPGPNRGRMWDGSGCVRVQIDPARPAPDGSGHRGDDVLGEERAHSSRRPARAPGCRRARGARPSRGRTAGRSPRRPRGGGRGRRRGGPSRPGRWRTARPGDPPASGHR